MKVCGIIAEYDPYHRGHLYHFQQAKKGSGADFMVCVLGSAFSQRGEAMLFSTHDRARMALANGFDLVLGLPVSFSCAQANRFAAGGVGILHSLGEVSHISFGSEGDSLEHLMSAARLLNQPDAAYVQALKVGLSQGLSFAAAQGQAMQNALPSIPPDLLRSPNFILGLSYLRELMRLQSDITPVPVLRSSAYHSLAAGPLASASAVRKLILEDRQTDLSEVCPEASCAVIQAARLHRPEALDKALLIHLLQADSSPSTEVSEGLDTRIAKAARQANGRAELIDLVKTKRYPRTRISRALSQSLLGLRQYAQRPAYARLLGFHERAKPLLAAIGRAGFPLITRPAREAAPEVAQDMLAEELWYIGSGQSAAAAWQQQVILLK